MASRLNQLKNILGKQFGIDPSKIQQNTDLKKELGFDSLALVKLFKLIENEFDIEIEDSISSQIATVQDVLNYIHKKDKELVEYCLKAYLNTGKWLGPAPDCPCDPPVVHLDCPPPDCDGIDPDPDDDFMYFNFY